MASACRKAIRSVRSRDHLGPARRRDRGHGPARRREAHSCGQAACAAAPSKIERDQVEFISGLSAGAPSVESTGVRESDESDPRSTVERWTMVTRGLEGELPTCSAAPRRRPRLTRDHGFIDSCGQVSGSGSARVCLTMLYIHIRSTEETRVSTPGGGFFVVREGGSSRGGRLHRREAQVPSQVEMRTSRTNSRTRNRTLPMCEVGA